VEEVVDLMQELMLMLEDQEVDLKLMEHQLLLEQEIHHQ
jgi:hypothetical protein